jgi:type IV secretion system protein VirB6
MSNLNIYGFISATDTVINTFLDKTYPLVADAAMPMLSVILILYWAVLGVRIYTGNAPFDWAVMLQTTVVSVLSMSMFAWGGVAHQLYMTFVNFADGLSSLMSNETMPDLVDHLWRIVGMNASVLMGEQIANIGMVLQGYGLMLLNCLLFVVMSAYLVVAKLGLAVMMVLMPVFTCMGLFKMTRQWLVNVLAMMLNFALLYIFTEAIVNVGFLIFEESIKTIVHDNAQPLLSNMTTASTTFIYLTEGVLLLLLIQAKRWASVLSANAMVSGGAYMQSFGRG